MLLNTYIMPRETEKKKTKPASYYLDQNTIDILIYEKPNRGNTFYYLNNAVSTLLSCVDINDNIGQRRFNFRLAAVLCKVHGFHPSKLAGSCEDPLVGGHSEFINLVDYYNRNNYDKYSVSKAKDLAVGLERKFKEN